MAQTAGRVAALFGGAATLLCAIALWHTSVGTSGVGGIELLRGIIAGDGATRDLLTASRLPRMLAGLVAGIAFGAAGAIFQSVARNSLASPDTLGVTGGAFFFVTAISAFGITLPLWLNGFAALVGGLGAAALVLSLGTLGAGSTTRLILAGSAVGLSLNAATGALLLLFDEQTKGLYAWGSGSLSQVNLDGVRMMTPVLAGILIAAFLLARKLDLLALGDDSASVLGINVARTRVLGVVTAVGLSAVAVALCGPVGFVGLVAPAVARLIGRWLPALLRHSLLIPLSAVIGAVVVLTADAAVRTVTQGVEMPTGIATTFAGAVVLVILARQSRDSGATRRPSSARVGPAVSVRRFAVVLIAASATLIAALIVGLLAGYQWLLTGDVINWFAGVAPPGIDFALEERTPRVLAAVFAGAALAISGTMVQSVARNPLAEPGTLGVTAGAGIGAVAFIVAMPTIPVWGLAIASTVSGLCVFALVYLLARRSGLDSDRLVLIGIGVWYGGQAIVTYLILKSDPWNTPKMLTWLSGSTYGRSFGQIIPVAIALMIVIPLLVGFTRELDLLALDDDCPRIFGLPLERVRLAVLATAAVLAALSTTAIGVVAFVGLVAPHAARALVGGRHHFVLPVAMALGAALVSIADTLGRTVIAPAQLPSGLVVSLIGAPYFVYLLYRSRA